MKGFLGYGFICKKLDLDMEDVIPEAMIGLAPLGDNLAIVNKESILWADLQRIEISNLEPPKESEVEVLQNYAKELNLSADSVGWILGWTC